MCLDLALKEIPQEIVWLSYPVRRMPVSEAILLSGVYSKTHSGLQPLAVWRAKSLHTDLKDSGQETECPAHHLSDPGSKAFLHSLHKLLDQQRPQTALMTTVNDFSGPLVTSAISVWSKMANKKKKKKKRRKTAQGVYTRYTPSPLSPRNTSTQPLCRVS